MLYIGTIIDAYQKGNDDYASLKNIEDNPYDPSIHFGHWNSYNIGWKEHNRVTEADAACIERIKELIKVYTKYPKGSLRPSWTVLYNTSAIGSRWIGTAWEFFDDEKSAQKRYDDLARFTETPNGLGFKYCPTKRPYYPACDREHLGAAHAWNKEG